jgi:hypothetical protein
MKVEARQAPGVQKRVRRTGPARRPRSEPGRSIRGEQLVAWASDVYCFRRSTGDAVPRTPQARPSSPWIEGGEPSRALRDEQLVAWASEVFCFRRSIG